MMVQAFFEARTAKTRRTLPPFLFGVNFAAILTMSALHPKADMWTAKAHVCFGPQADIGRR
jgi:hypothetical protein